MSISGPGPENTGAAKNAQCAMDEKTVLKREFLKIHGRSGIANNESYEEAVHQLIEGQSALCLSGGGIRSAAFSLGILQGLARCGVLDKFHYLSTVSGGGYMGSWLTAWKSRTSLQNVVEELARTDDKNAPDAISNLRGGSTYLTPQAGLFSADTWTDIVLIFRNLLLIDLLIIPLFAAVLVVAKWLFLERHEILALLPEEFAFHAPVIVAGIAWIVLAQRRPSWARRRPISYGKEGDKDAENFFPRMAILLFWFASMLFIFSVQKWFEFRVKAYTPGNPFFVASEAWAAVKSGMIAGLLTAGVSIGITRLTHRPADSPSQGKVVEEIPGSWPLIMGYLAIAGAVAGILIYFWLVLIKKMWVTTRLDSEMSVAMIFWASPAVFALAMITAENIYLGLNTRRKPIRSKDVWNDRWGDEEREWVARSYGYLLVAVIASGTLLCVGLFGWSALHMVISSEGASTTLNITKKILAGIVALFSGLATIGLGSSSFTRGNGASPSNRKFPARGILIIATPIFGILLMIGLSALLDQILFQESVLYAPVKNFYFEVFAAFMVLTVTPFLLSRLFNINRYSLHDLYRNRLTREFLGASNQERKGDPWTGFDASDDVKLGNCASPFLYPVINVTLNALHQTRLQLLHRQGLSFVFTPRYCGSRETGYRPTRKYGEGIRLGVAMAVSGAAVSPNAGYSTMKGLSLLLTIFNLRLGVWAGNPRDGKAWRNRGPKWALFPLFSEAFSQTNERARYVYLSDGGHFDNLGLFEMLKRRCRYIVVSDASADSEFEFEDLGRAVRRAALELNVRVEFPKDFDLGKRGDTPFSGPYSAVAEVIYPEKDPRTNAPYRGKLLYIKAGYHGKGEPMDVRAFAAANPKFPHDPTSNQFFDENYFESYRSLGEYIIRDLHGDKSHSSSMRAFLTICAISARNTTEAPAHPHLA